MPRQTFGKRMLHYGEPWAEQIGTENVLEVLNDQWLSASSITFYIRYLDEAYLSKNKDLATKYSCMSLHFTSKVDRVVANNLLADCLLKYDRKDHLVFVPHNVGEHWLLIAINNKNQDIYFLDPARNSKIANYNDLKMFIESARSRLMEFIVVITLGALLRIYCLSVLQLFLLFLSVSNLSNVTLKT